MTCTAIHVSKLPPLKSMGNERGATPSSDLFEDPPLFRKGAKRIEGNEAFQAKKDKQTSPVKGSIMGEWARLVGLGVGASVVAILLLRKRREGSNGR